MFPDFKTHKNTHTSRISGFQQGARMGEPFVQLSGHSNLLFLCLQGSPVV